MIKICDITEDGKYTCDIGGASYLEVRDGKKEWVLYGLQDKARLYPKYRKYEWPYPWKDTRQVEKVVLLSFYEGGFGVLVSISDHKYSYNPITCNYTVAPSISTDEWLQKK